MPQLSSVTMLRTVLLTTPAFLAYAFLSPSTSRVSADHVVGFTILKSFSPRSQVQHCDTHTTDRCPVRSSPERRMISPTALSMAGGFGERRTGGDAVGIIPDAPGSAEAQTALRSADGDLNRATSIVFQRRLEKLQEGDRELGDMLRELSASVSRSAAPVASEAVHEALVSATWDAVAVMNALPKGRLTSADQREEKRITKRLRAIADTARIPPGATQASREDPPEQSSAQEALVEGTRDPPRFIGKILDIGCGDGALMPHLVDPTAATADKKKGKVGKGLKKKRKQAEEQKGSEAPEEVAITGPAISVQEADVTGVDLSEVMIAAAQLKYPKARWLTGNALALPNLLGMNQPEPLFSSIIFNGSLQFFRDPPQALAEAARWLIDGGHIVVAHVQGSDFVREECRKNPRVAPSPMPGRQGMDEWADAAGCSLLEGADDFGQRDFLLQVMRKV